MEEPVQPQSYQAELAEQLLQALPEDRSDDPERWRIQELLAWLLEFHRRDSKPMWWKMFDRHEMNEDQLYDDLDCLAGLKRTHGGGDPVARIVLENGILVEGQTGGDGWHPFSSGRTFFEVNPFLRSQQFTSDASGDFEIKTSGLTFGLVYDNTDFSENPSRGSYKKVALSSARSSSLSSCTRPGAVALAAFRVSSAHRWSALNPSGSQSRPGARGLASVGSRARS